MSWVQPQAYDHRLFDQLDLRSPFGRLCLILAPALRIEPRLLRNARQRYLPRSDASLENRLWFSRVVETRGTRSVNLRPGLARLLVDRLVLQGGTQGRERLARICDFIIEQTRDWDALDRLEQSLRWAVRDDDQARVSELLRELLRRIGASTEESSRADLARWIKGALSPLQAVTEAHRESGWLAQFAGAALGDTGIVLRGHGTLREPMPDWLATLLPTGGGMSLGLRLGRSDERLILECLEPEPGLPRLDLFTPAPAPVYIECEDRAHGSLGWVSLFVGCRIPVGRACRALILQTIDGRRFRVASREGSEAINADYSPPRKVVLVCAPGDARRAFRIADLLKRQGVQVRVEQLALTTLQIPDFAAADPDEQLVALWSRYAASAIQNDYERVRNVFSSAANGAAYRLLVGLDKTPLPEVLGAGGTEPARVDFSEAPADWGVDEVQALLSALSSEHPGALQVLRADNTVEEFKLARLADDIADSLPAASGQQAWALALAQQIEANLRRRYPRGGIVDTVEIGDEVERVLVQAGQHQAAGEHQAARAYAERELRGLSRDPGRDSAQAPAQDEREPATEETAWTDIYLSHAHADQSVARELANRFADSGLRVFAAADTGLQAGDSWQKFEQMIGEAGCVVVLWSSAARKSDAVKAEATWAVERNKYFPTVLDDFANVPPEFKQYHSADLRGWPRKNEAEEAFEQFLTELRDSIAAGARKESSPSGVNTAQGVETDRLIAELDDPLTPPPRRLAIGDRLAELGDPRPGVGLDEHGIPDIDWVHIPAGPFLYGKSKEFQELPDFLIARHPVTNAQYQAFIDAGGYRDERWWPDLAHRIESPTASQWPMPNRPKTDVSWFEAIAYCRWLSARLGYELRLPTEREWEKAARGTDGREYPWGDEYREGSANVREYVGELNMRGLSQTTAVGIYRHGASIYGVLDTSGNVREWCRNEYEKPANTGLYGDVHRMVRGSDWGTFRGDCRVGYRMRHRPDYRDDRLGFRVCRDSPIDLPDAEVLATGGPSL